jgi:hypothetical protein
MTGIISLPDGTCTDLKCNSQSVSDGLKVRSCALQKTSVLRQEVRAGLLLGGAQ